MATVDLTSETFESTITDNDIVLVDFWASWCGPCRQFAPVYEDASNNHTDIVFGKVDTEAEQQLAGAAQITSIPTLMVFREGVLVFSQPGALPAPALDQVIDAVRALDMDDVHKKMEAQRELADKPLEVSQEEFAKIHADGATVIDVREPNEYQGGHVPGALLLPLNLVPQRMEQDIPAAGEDPVYVICASGARSAQAAEFLRANGIEAYSVAGGTSGWVAAGREVETGAAAN